MNLLTLTISTATGASSGLGSTNHNGGTHVY